MRKSLLVVGLILAEAARFNDKPDMRSDSNSYGIQSWPSSDLLNYVERGHRFGDYRISSQMKLTATKSSTTAVQFDPKTAGYCDDCEYLLGSTISNSCLTTAGTGSSRCSSYEDKLGFMFAPFKSKGGREYVQISNTIDGLCLQDTPAKLVTSRAIMRGLFALFPKILRTEVVDGPHIQRLINMIWLERSMPAQLKPFYGSCLKPSAALFSYQLWHIEALTYTNKGFLLRNARSNRCLSFNGDGVLSVADCIDPDAASNEEGALQAAQTIAITPRASALSFRQSAGNSRCLQMLAGSPMLVECVLATNSRAAMGASSGLFDFRPAGGCVESMVRTKAGFESRNLCAFTLLLFSPSAPKGSDHMCLIVKRQLSVGGKITYRLDAEKCAINATVFDPSATPLVRRGSFADAEKARSQIWWVERVEDEKVVVGGAEKILMRWRFADGDEACVTHSATEVTVASCLDVDDASTATWLLDPFVSVRG
eukprot:GDKJ01058085.1.p1 GENE.GDKJ01058085.1~~GDKJ01058085.1.p1  ORF type:complete len:482 (-),score=91.44 GDKJ01058085.1:210-1655(-)